MDYISWLCTSPYNSLLLMLFTGIVLNQDTKKSTEFHILFSRENSMYEAYLIPLAFLSKIVSYSNQFDDRNAIILVQSHARNLTFYSHLAFFL